MNVNIWNYHIFELRIKDRNTYELSINQLPDGLIALLKRCTGIAEVMGSIPVQAWIFSGFFSQLR